MLVSKIKAGSEKLEKFRIYIYFLKILLNHYYNMSIFFINAEKQAAIYVLQVVIFIQ